MKILQFVTAVGDVGRTGGVAEVAMTQTEILRSMGHDVTLLAGWIGEGRPPSELRGLAATVLPVHNPARGGTDLRLLISPAIHRWLRRHGDAFDVAHVHLCRDLITTFGARALHRRGVPIVTQSHGMLTPARSRAFRAFDAAALRPALRTAAMGLTLWPGEQDQLDEALGRHARTRPVYNAVDVGERTWMPSEPPVVLFAARLHARKQPQLFVQLAARVHAEFPAVRFVIAGPDQGEEAAVRALVDASGLADVVRITGGMPRDLLLDRMTTASLYVLPSLDEPFPISAMEAMAVGLPSVLTEQSGISGMAAQHDAAVIAAPDLDATTDAVLDLLRHPERWAGLSERGRQLCSTVFSRASLGETLVSCYSDVVSSGHRAAAEVVGR